MALLPLGLLLLINVYQFTSAAPSASPSFYLSAELSNFVPDCAKACFESFLDANFPISSCTSSPSLQCLCSQNTTSGYTIAEGAVQCIISEDDIGTCTGVDASEAVVEDAYAMCTGQVGALPNTHATLTATLLESPSSSGVLLFPHASTTSSSSTSTTSAVVIASSTSSTSRSTTSSIQTTSTTSSQSTFSSITTSSSSSSSTSSSTSAPLASDTSSSTTVSSLTRPQVIGIAVGSAGGAAFALGALVLVACLRRKRARENRDSDMLPFQLEPNYPSSLDLGFRGPAETKTMIYGPGGTSNGLATKIPPQVPPRGPSTSPNMFSRRSIPADTIGLAVSADPARSTSPVWRKRSSKLLPEKPDMGVGMPKEGMRSPQAFGFPKPPLTIPVRASTDTTFEEDLETPSTQRRSTIPGTSQPENRDMSGTLQIPPSLYIKPLNISRRPSNNYSQPFRPPTHTSSIYSAQPSTAHSATSSIMNRPRKSYKQYHPYRADRDRGSSASLTSFESLDSIFDDQPKTGVSGVSGDLSPVVESPRPLPNARLGLGGTSTGSPLAGGSTAGGQRAMGLTAGRLPQDTIRLVPPPPQPDFAAAVQRDQEMKQISPTDTNPYAARTQSPPINPGPYAARTQSPPVNPNPYATRTQSPPINPNPYATRTQSPPINPNPYTTRNQTSKPWEKFETNAARARKPSLSRERDLPPPPETTAVYNNLWGDREGQGPQESQQSRAPQGLESLPSQRQRAPQGPQGLQNLPSQRQRGPQESQGLQSLPSQRLRSPQAPFMQPQASPSDGRASTTPSVASSTASSLFAKRRGSKAPVLTVGAGAGGDRDGDKGKGGGKKGWRIITDGEERVGAKGGRYGDAGQLPGTPGWKPRLTPTRRGEDLFISVQ